jgi:catechol 2,3-dioxygenase-like lactoylglutathione lyase family enzyme
MKPAAPRAGRLFYISRNVADLSRSVAFYRRRLGFGRAGPSYGVDAGMARWLGMPGRPMRAQRLRCGGQIIELIEVGRLARPYPPDSTAADLWFQHFAIRCTHIEPASRLLFRTDIDAPLPQAISRSGRAAETAIALPLRSGGAAAFKFRDPDGHPLELIQFPAHADAAEAHTAGIDHCAIAVGDVDRSIAFYRHLLGLAVAARQVNWGAEQGALDGLTTAIADVVALRSPLHAEPHLELLGYRTPIGRKTDPAAAPGDIASDRLVFDKRLLSGTQETGSGANRTGPYPDSIALQDPDGHRLLFVSGE